MKKLLTIALIILATQVFAQTNPITSINITLPTNPDANTGNWINGKSLLLISASSQSATGRINPAVEESRMLVMVKLNGSKVCGDYTSNSAPSSDFNTVTKIWSGGNAASFLGKGCILKPGDYELSVQFFGTSNGKTIALSDEKIKPFTIKGEDLQTYQVSQAIGPANGTVFKQADILKPITLRWTPPVPKPQEPITYRINVFQLTDGQTPTQAIKTGQPVFTKDVVNITQVVIPNLTTGTRFHDNNDPRLGLRNSPVVNDFAWTVTSLNKDGKGYGPNNGISEPATFKYSPVDTNRVLTVVPATQVVAPYLNKYAIAVTGISPNEDCATTDVRPNFQWKLENAPQNTGNITHQLTLVEMAVTDTSEAAFDTKTPILVKNNINTTSYKIPGTSPALVMGKIYAWRVKTFQSGILAATSDINFFYINSYKLPFDITSVTCCTTTIVANGSFQDGNVSGVLGNKGAVTNWNTGNGGPIVSSNTDGANDPGYVRIQGNMMSGSSIKQSLSGANKIVQGKHYRVTLSVRFKKLLSSSKYVLIKVIAFNGTLPSTELHPTPTSDIAVVGWTGKLTLDEWGSTSLNIWTANKGFANIGVYCYTNARDSTAVCDIDDICFAETKESQSCDDYAYNAQGQPIIDSSVTNHGQDTTYNNYSEYLGLTSDLYSQQGNTALDNFYPANDPCSSIGGYLPPGVANINFADSLHTAGFPGSAADLDKLLSQTFPDSSKVVDLPKIPPITTKCNTPVVLNNNLPFGGRDLIFVHGLQLGHLCDRRNGVSGAQANWPADAAAFYGNGYYKKIAEDCWADHIRSWLTSKGYKNRYLIIAYNCSQPMNVAVHAMLKQIRDAMNDGTGVVADKSDKRGTSCFGVNSVIISHSTGGLLTDIAMSTAEKSKTDPTIQSQFGNVGYIADNVKAHVAFHPVLEGSKMATVYLAVQTSPVLATLLNSGVCHDLIFPTPEMIQITYSSILVDLQPSVVKLRWSSFVDSTPVPTITVAGGHPSGVNGIGIFNWAIHPGLDDGVSTMSSQSGNPNFETGLTPSGYFYAGINPFRVFDMGISVLRAASYYNNQTMFTLPHYVGGASVTNLSPTGMVQPVGSVAGISSPENRYRNHYSFIQSASDHFMGPRGRALSEGFDPNNFPASSGYQAPNYNYATSFGEINYEESRAITNMDIYNKGLVSTAVETMQAEHVRGLTITIAIPIPNFALKRHPLRLKFWWSYYYINIPIWERRYDNLVGYENQDECSYVYNYVLRQ